MKYLICPFIQVQDINGKPIAGAKIYVYEADTTTSVITYQNFDRGLNTDPVLTDELGNATIIVEDDQDLCDVYIYDDKDNFLMSKKYILPGSEGGTGSNVVLNEGFGINISQSGPRTFTISVDTDLIATKDDLSGLQEKLTGGDNIEITQDNVINVTGRKTLFVESPLTVSEETNRIIFGVDGNAIQPASAMTGYLTKSEYAAQSGTFLTGVNLNDYATVDWTQNQLDTKLDVTAYQGGSTEISATYMMSAADNSNHDYLVTAFDLPRVNGKLPRAAIGNFEWASTDGYISFFPASNTGFNGTSNYAVPLGQYWNAGHGDSNLWNTVCLNFTANDNASMAFVAIKGSSGQSYSALNCKFTCFY